MNSLIAWRTTVEVTAYVIRNHHRRKNHYSICIRVPNSFSPTQTYPLQPENTSMPKRSEKELLYHRRYIRRRFLGLHVNRSWTVDDLIQNAENEAYQQGDSNPLSILFCRELNGEIHWRMKIGGKEVPITRTEARTWLTEWISGKRMPSTKSGNLNYKTPRSAKRQKPW